MKNFLPLIAEFHEASKLPVYIANDKRKIIRSFHLAITPELPSIYLRKIPKNISKLAIYTIGNQEYLGIMPTKSQAFPLIILWANTRTIEKTGYYEDKFPTIGLKRFVSYAKILYFALFQQLPEIDETVSITDNLFIFDETSYSAIGSEQTLQIAAQHNDYAKESLMWQAVTNANMAEFNQRLAAFIKSGSFGQMASLNQLRNKKDLVLSAVTLITRAAISGGMNANAAFALSDKCYQRIEKISVLDSVSNLIQEIAAIFINRLRADNKSPQSQIVFRVKDYTYTHLNQKISLDNMCISLGYAKTYLCSLFKRETGMTIIHYVNQQKISEAKSLLAFTHLPIATIADLLGWSDQGYLTKIFLQNSQLTPSQYRKKTSI